MCIRDSYYSTLAGYYGYDLDGLVQNLLGYESTDDMLAHLESSLENYSKAALLYQAVAESLDITPTQEQLDAYSDYKDTYGPVSYTHLPMAPPLRPESSARRSGRRWGFRREILPPSALIKPPVRRQISPRRKPSSKLSLIHISPRRLAASR